VIADLDGDLDQQPTGAFGYPFVDESRGFINFPDAVEVTATNLLASAALSHLRQDHVCRLAFRIQTG